jgi:hypothetical protein
MIRSSGRQARFAVDAANVDRLWQESEKLIVAVGFPLLTEAR